MSGIKFQNPAAIFTQPVNCRFKFFDSQITGGQGTVREPYRYNIKGAMHPADGLKPRLFGEISPAHWQQAFVAFESRQGILGYAGLRGARDLPGLYRENLSVGNGDSACLGKEGEINFLFKNLPILRDAKFVCYFPRIKGGKGGKIREFIPGLQTAEIDWKVHGLPVEHPYVMHFHNLEKSMGLRKGGYVPRSVCFGLNKNLWAPAGLDFDLSDPDLTFDYQFGFSQVSDPGVQECAKAVIELGWEQIGYPVAKQCGGVVIYPGKEDEAALILSVHHATCDESGKDIVNFMRKGETIVPLGNMCGTGEIKRLFTPQQEKKLDISIFKVDPKLLQVLYAARDIPWAKLDFDPLSRLEAGFKIGYPHFGYPDEPTDIFAARANRLKVPAQIGKLLKMGNGIAVYRMLILHGDSGSAVFDIKSRKCSGIVLGSYDYCEDKFKEGKDYEFFAPYLSIMENVVRVRTFGSIKKMLIQAVPFLDSY